MTLPRGKRKVAINQRRKSEKFKKVLFVHDRISGSRESGKFEKGRFSCTIKSQELERVESSKKVLFVQEV